jgi:hypothetical protein
MTRRIRMGFTDSVHKKNCRTRDSGQPETVAAEE